MNHYTQNARKRWSMRPHKNALRMELFKPVMLINDHCLPFPLSAPAFSLK